MATLIAYTKRVNDEREAKEVVDYNKALEVARARLLELNEVAASKGEDDDVESELQQLEFEIEFMESRGPARPPKFLCLEIHEFIDKVFYHRKFKKYADNTREDHLIVGHNLPFDLGAISSHSNSAIEELFGGISMKLCRCDLEKYYQKQLAKFYGGRGWHKIWDKTKNTWSDEIYTPSMIEYLCSKHPNLLPMAGPSTSRAMIPWVKHATPRKPSPQAQCGLHPNVTVMKLGHGKHLYDANMVRQGGKVFSSHLRFGDGMQARAFLGPVAGGIGLGNLGEVLGVATKKAESDLKEFIAGNAGQILRAVWHADPGGRAAVARDRGKVGEGSGGRVCILRYGQHVLCEAG